MDRTTAFEAVYGSSILSEGKKINPYSMDLFFCPQRESNSGARGLLVAGRCRAPRTASRSEQVQFSMNQDFILIEEIIFTKNSFSWYGEIMPDKLRYFLKSLLIGLSSGMKDRLTNKVLVEEMGK